MKKFIKNYWALSIPVVILVIAVLFLFNRETPNENRVIGMVKADFTDIASEIPGRLDSLLVHQGDTVKRGDLLAVIEGNEVSAIKEQTMASITAAESQLKMLENGARPEAIKSAKNLQHIAQQQFDLVKKSYDRMVKLYKQNVISGQEKDMISFKLQAAKKELESAKLHVQSLERGSRPEAIKSAKAVLEQAKKAHEISNSFVNKTKIYAPVDGIISSSIVHLGEVVNMGYPMMTIQQENSMYIDFNIRQDKIKNIHIGEVITVKIPGCEPEKIQATITQISPALTFANWVPEEKSGRFELRTFTVSCKPYPSIKGLRPGMTAAFNLSE